MKDFKKISYNDLIEILSILSKNIIPRIELNANNDAYILLVSVVLSAQATDISVNKVLPLLFNFDEINIKNNTLINNNIIDISKDYTINKRNIDYILSLSIDDIEQKIKSIGLYKNKAKNIYHLTRIIFEKHNYMIPNNRYDLEKLPGVGRKSANIILNVIFNEPVVPVDTHVFRVAHRLGISNNTNRDKVEMDIVNYFIVLPLDDLAQSTTNGAHLKAQENNLKYTKGTQKMKIYLESKKDEKEPQKSTLNKNYNTEKYKIGLFQKSKDCFFKRSMRNNKEGGGCKKIDPDPSKDTQRVHKGNFNIKKNNNFFNSQSGFKDKLANYSAKKYIYDLLNNKKALVYDNNNFLKNLHYYFVLHGRYTCTAKKPKCKQCPLSKVCLFFLKTKK